MRFIFNFTLVLSGDFRLTDEVTDALYEAGCDDSTPRSQGPTVYLDFHREAVCLGDAIGSAVKDVERCGLVVVRIDVGPSQILKGEGGPE